MKRFGIAGLCSSLILAAVTLASTQQSTTPDSTDPLAVLAWLEGKWAVEKEEPGGGKALRESYFEWAPNKRALRFWSFVTGADGKRTPYVDGWYAWDPVAKKIRFGYVDPQSFYEGEVTVDGPMLDHVFTGHHANGRTVRWRYTLARAGDGSMPAKIYTEREGQWSEMVSLMYQRQKP